MKKTHEFQAEVADLLGLMINSLYSNKEIFLRELISNASDALDKLSYLTVSDEKYKNLAFTPRIDINFDEKRRVIRIWDNGIGMDESELVSHLGTIAKSGTKAFLQNLSGDKQKDSALIGQFGVGFYSAFMVAQKIIVTTKKPLQDTAFSWISDGKNGYEIFPVQKDGFGTEITLYLKEEDAEFASRWRITQIVKKYSSHIQFPIFLHYDETPAPDPEKPDEKPAPVEKIEQQNDAKAIWKVPKKDLTRADYDEFYASLGSDGEPPLAYVHNLVEGNLQYQSLFFIPSVAPFDLFRVDYKSGVKLYVKRVFITDDDKELLPQYLRFVRGVIDSDDLPLNVSREILQQNKILANIKSACTKKILAEIANLAADTEKYAKFWKNFGRVMKEGLYGDFENRDALLDLMRFESAQTSDLSLKIYVEKMPPEQKSIYFLLGNDAEILKNASILEKYAQKGFDVLLLSDEVDAFVMPQVMEYTHGDKKIPIKDASNEDALKEISDEKIDENTAKDFADLIAEFKKILGDKISDVRLTTAINSPVLLLTEARNPMMENIFAQMGQAAPKPKNILELNANHEIIIALKTAPDPKKIQILYDLSLVQNGKNPIDAKVFAENIFALL